VGSNDDKLYAIDTATGKEDWRFSTGGSVESSPAVSNGIVYVGSFDKNLYAIDAATGTEKWRFETGGTWQGNTYGSAVYSSPAVSNGIVYVGSWDYNLYAIDAATGRQRWAINVDGQVWSSPVVSNGFVYVGSNYGYLYAVGAAPSGQVITHTSTSAQTTAATQTMFPHKPAETATSTSVWDRNNLIYVVLLVFVFLFGAILFDTYYKKKK
jgi:outer membrane protein assembly factor BamB